jgi:phosphatidylserine decarboxylase
LGAAGYGLASTGHTYLAWVCYLIGLTLAGFMVYFFRDPERAVVADPNIVVAGADGWVRRVEEIDEPKYLQSRTIRISTFLTPFDVHVNRSPIAGAVKALAYTPGKHILTIQQAASEYNEHSSIYIEGQGTRCLVKQIVGPIVRRVVYWLEEGQELAKGDRIGIMKFGSRMDVYLPVTDVEVLVKKGDRVFAGKTVLARLKTRN